MLNKRTEAHLRGACRIEAGRPAVEVHETVYYTPHIDNGRWGVFDRFDNAVALAVERGGAELEPLRQAPESPTSFRAVADSAPSGLDYIYGGRYVAHFGHFLLETLSRLWFIEDGLRPDQRLVMHGDGTPDDWFALPYVRDIFGALGVTPDRILHSDVPLKLDRLVVPGAAFQAQGLAHTVFASFCLKLGERLLGGGEWPSLDEQRPIYFSKTKLTQGVAHWINEIEIEQALSASGVSIVHPQFLPLAEQIRLHAGKSIISGVVGSGHHVSLFAPPRGRFCMLSPQTINSNFFLVDRLTGNAADYVYPEGTHNVPRENTGYIVERVVENPTAVAAALLAMF